MSAVMKCCRTAGVALVGAAVVVTTPAGGPVQTGRAASLRYTLTAAATPSPANVPVNLFNLFMSMPAWEIQAMGRLADAMEATGSWQVWSPTNVFGFDEQDPPKLKAIIDMTFPVAPVSSALGEQISWWAVANLPMNAGCAGAQGACPDPGSMVRSMFTVPLGELYRGYQFPTVTNPFTGQPTSWSGQYVKLDRGAAAAALRDYLTAPPVGIATVTPAEAANTVSRLTKSFNTAFYPFVQDSEWFDSARTPLAPLFRALAPVLCASCEANPYDNPWLKNYPPKPASGQNPAPIAPPAAAVALATEQSDGNAAADEPATDPTPAPGGMSAPAAVDGAEDGDGGGRHRRTEVRDDPSPTAGRHRAVAAAAAGPADDKTANPRSGASRSRAGAR